MSESEVATIYIPRVVRTLGQLASALAQTQIVISKISYAAERTEWEELLFYISRINMTVDRNSLEYRFIRFYGIVVLPPPAVE